MRLMVRHAWIALILVAPSAEARDSFIESLRKIEPRTRLEQVCDFEAMKRIKAEKGVFADRAKSDVSASPEHKGHTLVAQGAAYRAGGNWYRLSFTCTATPDHLQVLTFKYKVGGLIPESKWDEYGLWR